LRVKLDTLEEKMRITLGHKIELKKKKRERPGNTRQIVDNIKVNGKGNSSVLYKNNEKTKAHG